MLGRGKQTQQLPVANAQLEIQHDEAQREEHNVPSIDLAADYVSGSLRRISVGIQGRNNCADL